MNIKRLFAESLMVCSQAIQILALVSLLVFPAEPLFFSYSKIYREFLYLARNRAGQRTPWSFCISDLSLCNKTMPHRFSLCGQSEVRG
jgi:hypothetical protein